MTGGFPLLGSLANGQAIAGAGLVSAGVGLSANNTAGSYVQLTASTSYDASRVIVAILAGVQVTTAVSLAVGGAGSEVDIAANLLGGCGGITDTGSDFPTYYYDLPLLIKAGSRLSAKCQINTAYNAGTTYISVYCWLFDGGFTQGQMGAIDTIGFVSASTAGTTLTGSATPDVLGSYSQLTASSANDYLGLIIASNNLGTFSRGLVNLAVGGAGSEQVIAPQLYFRSEPGSQRVLPFMPIQIAAGSRISAAFAGGTASGQLGLVVYGIR